MRWTIYPAKAHKVCLADHAVWTRHTNWMRAHWLIPYLPCGNRNIRSTAAQRYPGVPYRDLMKDKGERETRELGSINESLTHALLVPVIGESASPLS